MFFLLQAAAGSKSSPTGMLSMMLPFILMFVVMYFLILRPQKTRDYEPMALLSIVNKHDRVVTAGGVHGVVTSARENDVILRIDDAKDVKVKVDRSAIVTVLEVSYDNEEENQETAQIPKESKGTK